MNDTTLDTFRGIAADLMGTADWQWTGQHMSQRHFGITQARAEALAVRHGGVAKAMQSPDRCHRNFGHDGPCALRLDVGAVVGSCPKSLR